MKNPTEITDARVIKALGHPLRMRILGLLDGRTASPKELAGELGEPLGNVSYHVRTLSELGFIELVRKKPRRGAIEHFYRAKTRHIVSDDDWARLPGPAKSALLKNVLTDVAHDIKATAASGGFEAEDAHVSRSHYELDEPGRRELVKALGAFLERARRIEKQSKERMAGSDGRSSHRLGSILLMFELPAERPDEA